MDSKELFEKYRSRLAQEGILKALIVSIIIGFAVIFVASFVEWLVGFYQVLIPIAAGVVAIGISMPLFYYKKFRPTTKSIARRVDKLGLEERIITMTELEAETSYIALRQREDAKENLGKVDSKQIKLAISRASIIAAAVVAVFGLSMTGVTILTAEGVINGGKPGIDIIVPPAPPIEYTIDYMADEGGVIDGEEFQVVYAGENATPVMAVPDEGWAFTGWSDGIVEPARQDIRIGENLTITAMFAEVGDGEEGEEGGEGEEGEPDENQEPQDGEAPPPEPGDPNDSASGGGRNDSINTAIDGETYYGDVIGDELAKAQEDLAAGKDIPQWLRDLIQAYYDGVQ